jgi:hypothetical protein
LIPRANLVTKEGVRLHLLDAQEFEEDPLHFQIVHHIYDMFHRDGADDKHYIVYVFENPEQYKTADFEADVHIPGYDLGGTPTDDQAPFVRPLRYNGLDLP